MTRWQTLISRKIFVLLLTGALVVPAVVSYAQPTGFSSSQPTNSSRFLPINEEDILVLEVRIGNKSTGHGLIAYQHEDSVLLPLGELCSILELGIMVDPDNGTAQGWIVDEDRTFNLNLQAQTISRDGKLTPLPPVLLGYDKNDIYIQSTVLEQWLPVDLDINLPRMHVKISPREILPFQSRLKRDEQRSYWLSRHGNDSNKYPMQLAPYRMWSYPQVDATAGFLTGRQEPTQRLALQSHVDLAGLSTNLFISHLGNNNNSQTIARLKAGRWNPDGGLLGPAAATQYEIGDLYISRVPLISTSKQGLGVMISNHSLSHSREIDTTEIQGDAPPGWEAELYINGTLYDFQTIGASGEFFFTNVPLVYGNNIFRTVLYGPRGETQEIVKNANISTEMSGVGELKYRAIIVQEGKGLLTTPPIRNYALAEAWNQQVELSYAVTSKHALVANVSRLKVEDKQELFSSLTSHNSLGRVYLETIIAKSMRGGSAYSLAAQARFMNQNLFASHNASFNYRAEAYYGHSYLVRRSVLRSSGNLLNLGSGMLFYNLSATHRNFEDSQLKMDNELKFHITGNINRFLLSHNIRYRESRYENGIYEELKGTQLIRTQVGPFSLRGDLNYEINPGRLRSTGATINWFKTDRIQFVARGSHFLRPEFGNDNLNLDLTVFFDNFSLGANYSYFKSGGPSIGLTIGTSLTRDIRSSCFAVQHRPLSNHSAASIRTFIDFNGNKVFDESDDPLPGVGFLNLTAWKKIRTNENGSALLTGLLVHHPQTIKLDLETIEDPYLIPLSEGVNVVGHPGSFVDVDFAFSYVGEMEGMVLDAGAMDAPIRHVGLEILDKEGNRIQSSVGEFDGYYYFSKLFPGEYRLSVIASTINTNRYLIPDPVPFLIPDEGGFVTGPDIILQRKVAVEPELPITVAIIPEEIEEEIEEEVEETQPAVEKVVVLDPKATDRTITRNTAPVLEIAKAEKPVPPVTGSMSPELAAVISKASPLYRDKSFPDFDKELTLSLVFEVLYRNSLWPDDPAP